MAQRVSPWLFVPLSFVVLTGCSSASKTSQPAKTNTGDPLFGSATVKPASYTPPDSPAPTTNVSAIAPSSTMPAPSSTKSTAALASGGHPSLDATHDLRIGGGEAQPPRDAWRGQSGDPAIVLNRPEAVPSTAEGPAPNETRNGGAIMLTGAAANIVSFDQAWAALRARGMTWSVLESSDNPNEWKFACWIPNRQNPDIHRSYEASGNDPLGVLRLVVAKIDQDR
jgi:hypothetical protein